MGHQAQFLGLQATEHTACHGQFLGHIHWQQFTHQRCSAHVGHQTPFGFQNGQLGIGCAYANVCTHGVLNTGAKTVAVNLRNHGHAQIAPTHAPGLENIAHGQPQIGVHNQTSLGIAHDRLHIETGTKRRALAFQDDSPQSFMPGQLLLHLAHFFQHGPVHTVVFLGAV